MWRTAVIVVALCPLCAARARDGSVQEWEETAASAFWAGANLPWDSFGYDIGGGAWNASFIDESFGTLSSHGANSVRFWLHADGRASPSFGADGSVTGMGGQSFAHDLKALVALAEQHKLVLELCLWSFDMCKQDMSGEAMHADLIRDEAKSRSYIEHALKPMLGVLNGSTHVVIEVINEPEWCMEGSCNTQECVAVAQMQRFAAMVAEAVHAATTPPLRVTVGSASLKWSTTLPGGGQASYWNDTALRAAYASHLGVLDFYNVHYYDWMYNPSYGYDMCRVPASHWGLDKPTVVAELPAASSHYSAAQMLNCSLAHGFAGDLFWAYNDPAFPLAPALAALAAFTAARPAATSYEALLAWLRQLPPPAPPPRPAAAARLHPLLQDLHRGETALTFSGCGACPPGSRCLNDICVSPMMAAEEAVPVAASMERAPTLAPPRALEPRVGAQEAAALAPALERSAPAPVEGRGRAAASAARQHALLASAAAAPAPATAAAHAPPPERSPKAFSRASFLRTQPHRRATD